MNTEFMWTVRPSSSKYYLYRSSVSLKILLQAKCYTLDNLHRGGCCNLGVSSQKGAPKIAIAKGKW